MAKITEAGPSHTPGDEPEGWVLTGVWEGSVLDDDESELQAEESESEPEEDKPESVPVDEPVVISRVEKPEPSDTPPRDDSGKFVSTDEGKPDKSDRGGKRS